MIHQLPSPQLNTVRSPLRRPVGLSMGASRQRPGRGRRLAIMRSSHRSRPRAGHLEAREAGRIDDADTLARPAAFFADDVEGIGALERRNLR